ncbi:MAG: methylmalonyl-CoA epimerase [Bacteroidota bacterium]
MKKVEHIGIAVKNLKSANALFSKLLDKNFHKSEKVESAGVTISFFQIGETKIELLEATNNNSPIAKFIEKRGEGIHHIAFEVENLQEEINRLENIGFILLNKEPQKGADNKLICFLHPQNTNDVLIELCQEIK